MNVSVAFCSYNGEKFLREQLDSILAQSYPVKEIIIVDDASTDGTPEILKNYAGQYSSVIKFFANETNLGVTRSFEKAISLCNGEVIFFCDQDDCWNKNKVAEIVNFFIDNQNMLATFSNAELIDEHSNRKGETLWDMLFFKTPSPVNDFNVFDYMLLYRNIITGAGLAIRKEALPFILPFPDTASVLHDEWIGLKLGSINRIGLLDKCLFNYRIHQQQYTQAISQKNTVLNRLKFYSITEDNAAAYPYDFYKHWNNRLSLATSFQKLGIEVSTSIINKIKKFKKQGLLSILKEQSFFKRKWRLLKLYLRQSEAITLSDVFFI